MLGTVLDKTTNLFERRFVLGLLLPCLAFAAGVLALFLTAYGWDAAAVRWRAFSAARQGLLIGGAVAAAVLAALLIGTQIGTLTRLWEGYWRGPVGRRAADLGRRRQRRRWDTLDLADPGDYMRRYYEFPVRADQLMPTRLGNVLKAAETYSGDPERYGADAVFFWPRLYLTLPEDVRKEVADARAAQDQMLVVTTLWWATALVSLAIGVAGLLPLSLWLSVTLGAAASAQLTHRSLLRAASVFGDLVRCAFDLHRRDLLTRLGVEPPVTPEEESALWRALAQRLYRRGTDHPELIRYRTATADDPA